MNKKVFIIFFPTDKIVEAPFQHLRPSLKVREMQMLSRIPQNKVDIYVVRNKEHFLGENKFIPQFKLHGTQWKSCSKEASVYGDLVYGFKIPDNTTHRYPSDIRDITIDKSIIQDLFPKYTINSKLAHNYKELEDYFPQIKGKIKVLKPLSESRGRGIIIGEALPPKANIEEIHYPYLVQEFLDTSTGFYNLCTGIHDFRVIILNGKIIAKILREPEDDTLISNTNFGGKITDVSDFILPEQVIKVIKDIEKYCSRYKHRYYSIDMGLGTDGIIKVFELNSAPALSTEYIAHKFGDYTAKNILKVS